MRLRILRDDDKVCIPLVRRVMDYEKKHLFIKILSMWEGTKTQKPLKLGLCRSYTNNTYTEMCCSVRRMWISAFSLKAITVSKKSP